jgi:tetratricopeptide (TPR) repeat protein
MTDSAITFYRQTLDKYPDFYKIHDRLGVIYFNRSSFDSAEYHYKAALRIDKDYANAYFNLGMLYYTQGKKSLAMSTFVEGTKYGSPPKPVENIINQLNLENIKRNNPDNE